jgi:D-3-phosphoglycerate dehydrogenase
MKVIAYNRSQCEEGKAIGSYVNLEELLATADVISLHCPLTAENTGMINADAISRMKDGVRFLNFARDALVDEKAMGEALESGKVRAYVTDFANPLSVRMKNAVVLPHLGASTDEAEENCAIMAVRELQDYLDNGNIKNSVNYPSIDAGICQTVARVAILHRNIPNMLSQITAFFGRNGLNIDNLASKSRGDYEYTLLDITAPMPHDTVERLKEIDGVLRVRRLLYNN